MFAKFLYWLLVLIYCCTVSCDEINFVVLRPKIKRLQNYSAGVYSISSIQPNVHLHTSKLHSWEPRLGVLETWVLVSRRLETRFYKSWSRSWYLRVLVLVLKPQSLGLGLGTFESRSRSWNLRVLVLVLKPQSLDLREPVAKGVCRPTGLGLQKHLSFVRTSRSQYVSFKYILVLDVYLRDIGLLWLEGRRAQCPSF